MLALTGCGLLPFGESSEAPDAPPPYEVTPIEEGAPVSPVDASTLGEAPVPPGVPPPPAYAGADMPLAPPPDPVIAAGPLTFGPEGTMGSLGLNLDSYFEDDEEVDTRLDRVERVLIALQRDLRTLATPILRLITVERDIQALVSQLAELAQAPQSASPPVSPSGAAPAGITPITPQATPPPQAAQPATSAAPTPVASGGYREPAAKGPVTVNRLRIGEHKDKTRIVLDASGPASYRYDLDNEEHLLVIELPQAGWSGQTQWQAKSKSPIIAAYNVYPMEGGGSRIVMQLKKDTAITYETVIKANGYADYRIVLDLRK